MTLNYTTNKSELHAKQEPWASEVGLSGLLRTKEIAVTSWSILPRKIR